MRRQPWMHGFDFDPEAAVQLCRAGVRPIRIDAPVRYFGRHEGGVPAAAIAPLFVANPGPDRHVMSIH